MSDDLVIELEHPDRPRRPGDVLRGRVHVRSGAGASCRGLHVRGCWKTHGRGNRDSGGVLKRTLHEGPVAGDGDRIFPFELQVPSGPYTYRGRLLNVDHYVEAWLDIPMAFDAKSEVEFVVVPGEDPAPPPEGLLERSEKAGKAGVGGCGVVAGIAMAFVGLTMLPFGLILIAVAAFLVVPAVRRAVAEKKLGRISAELRREVVAPGEDVGVEVAIHPDRDLSVTRVDATLRCREICVSGRGTDRTTHREEVASFPVTLEGPAALSKGERVVFEGAIRLPEDAALTFASSNNHVVWDVQLHVDIPSWPDWRERLPLVVWPGGEAIAGAGGEPVADGVEMLSPERGDPMESVEPVDPVEPAAAETIDPAGTPAAPTPASAGPTSTPTRAGPASPPPPPPPPPPPTPPPAPAASAPAASAPSEPEPLPPDAPELARRIRAILAEPRIGGRRYDRIDDLVGGEYEFTLLIERNERSFGVPAEYRDGRTIRGTVAGTELDVEVRFPPERNDEIQGLGRGDTLPVRARALQWESLDERPLLEA